MKVTESCSSQKTSCLNISISLSRRLKSLLRNTVWKMRMSLKRWLSRNRNDHLHRWCSPRTTQIAPPPPTWQEASCSTASRRNRWPQESWIVANLTWSLTTMTKSCKLIRWNFIPPRSSNTSRGQYRLSQTTRRILRYWGKTNHGHPYTPILSRCVAAKWLSVGLPLEREIIRQKLASRI